MKKKVVVSDLTGEQINDHVQIRVWTGKNEHLVDVDRSEPIVQQLIDAGLERPRRGRPSRMTA